MTKSKTVTLAISDPVVGIRKITKLITYQSGGFAFMVPYHSAKKGWLAKKRVDYRQERQFLPADSSQEYSAGDRVKLSFHADGFVQFSGLNPAKIISGRDPVTREPRGLGIVLPGGLLSVVTGPAFGAVVWGMQDFEKCTRAEMADTLLFSESDFHYRDCTPESATGYIVEGFILPKRRWRRVVAQMVGGYRHPGAFLKFKFVPLHYQALVLGFLVGRIRHSSSWESGYTLSSASDASPATGAFGNLLIAAYPAFPGLAEQSLDYHAQSATPSPTS